MCNKIIVLLLWSTLLSLETIILHDSNLSIATAAYIAKDFCELQFDITSFYNYQTRCVMFIERMPTW